MSGMDEARARGETKGEEAARAMNAAMEELEW